MKQNITMKDMPVSEQPYEKCEKYGPQYLSDSELLSVIIRTGNRGKRSTELAQSILLHCPGQTISGLYQISFEQLCEIKGVGKVKAIQLLCLTEISRRLMRNHTQEKELLCNEPSAVAAYFMPFMRHLETEQVRLLVLDGKNALKKEMVLSSGSFNSVTALPREIFYYALKHKAVSIIILHNHPSGEPAPSREDLIMTRRIAETGKIIGIPLLDHIIIGDNCYLSLREKDYFS